ncbi:hypothetical protein DFH28DRAFT_1126425 [Melampsora americana]|nr:hypothetical protein DFH28DRAFT_1126425 [Melampsora americana]
MRACGFLGGDHYWFKVIRTVGGISGVWYHNDMVNEGIATLVSSELESIGGRADHTQWVMYSRSPTTEEAWLIDAEKLKIAKSCAKNIKGDLPLSQIEPSNKRDDIKRDKEREESTIERDEIAEQNQAEDDLKDRHSQNVLNAQDELKYRYSTRILKGEDLFDSDGNTDEEFPKDKKGRRNTNRKRKANIIVKQPKVDFPNTIFEEHKVAMSQNVSSSFKGEVTETFPKGNSSKAASRKQKVIQKAVILEGEVIVAEEEKEVSMGTKKEKEKGWKGWAWEDVEAGDANREVKAAVSQEVVVEGNLRKSKRQRVKRG